MEYYNNKKQDISSFDDIKQLVDSFYSRVRHDELLGPVFNAFIKDWSEHLPKMYSFWQTVLLEEHTYFGSPFVPHAKLPVEKQHFERWLKLFNETVDEYFVGDLAEKAKWQGERMAQMFNMKIDHFRNNPNQKVI